MARSIRTTTEPAPGVTITTIASDQVSRVFTTSETALGTSHEHLITAPGNQSDHQRFIAADDSFAFVQHLAVNDGHFQLVRLDFAGDGPPSVAITSSNDRVGNVVVHTDAGTEHQLTHYDPPADLLAL